MEEEAGREKMKLKLRDLLFTVFCKFSKGGIHLKGDERDAVKKCIVGYCLLSVNLFI